jgi:hypothetical protein
LQKFDIVTLFLGVYLGIQKFRARNPVYQEVDSCIKNALNSPTSIWNIKKIFRGLCPLDPQAREGKRREWKGRQGNGRHGKGKEGKDVPAQGKILRTPLSVGECMVE